MVLTYEKAKSHLEKFINKDGDLQSVAPYLSWEKRFPNNATLDGEFNAEDLESIAVYMRGGG